MFQKNIAVNIVLLIFCFLSLVRLLIPGDDQVTMEGSGYALNMFNTSYFVKFEYQNSDMKETKGSFPMSYSALLHDIQKNCIDDRPRYLHLSLISQYNIYEVINESDYCKLEYKPFSHNEWIGRDLKYGEDLDKLNSSQRLFHSIQTELKFVYSFLFFFMTILTISKFMKKDDK